MSEKKNQKNFDFNLEDLLVVYVASNENVARHKPEGM